MARQTGIQRHIQLPMDGRPHPGPRSLPFSSLGTLEALSPAGSRVASGQLASHPEAAVVQSLKIGVLCFPLRCLGHISCTLTGPNPLLASS